MIFGHIRFFEHFTKQYLINFFKFADFIEINNNVLPLLLDRLDIKNELELFDMLSLELLVITKGKKGATFLYKDAEITKTVSKIPEIIVDAIDTSGAGDAFFSTLLKQYAYAEVLDKNFIDKAFYIANEASRKILKQFGSRSS